MTFASQTTNGSAGGDSVDPAHGQSDQTPASATRQAPSQQIERLHKTLSPALSRVTVGLLLVAGSFCAYVLSERGLDPDRFRYLTLSLAGLSCIVVLAETISLLLQPDRFSNPLSLFPASGVFLIGLGALGAVLVDHTTSSWLITTGPALAAGAFFLMRGLIMHFCNSLSESKHLFFTLRDELPLMKQGDRLTLQAGDVAPVDGRIEKGSCAVRERYLSTDVHFRIKDETDVIFAGSQVVGGSAEILALSGSEDSCLRSLERLVSPSIERVGTGLYAEDSRSRRATAYVLIFVAITTAILWDERSGLAWNTLCAAGLVFFSALVCQLAELLYARQRLMVRNWAEKGFVTTSSSAIAELAKVKKVLFDPSRIDLGSQISVRQLEILDDRVGREELCSCIAALLGRADDLTLLAAGDYCQTVAGTIAPDRVLNLQEIEGRGIRGSVKGVPLTIGAEDFLLEQGILIHPSESNVETATDERTMLVAVGGELVARFWIVFGQGALVSGERGKNAWLRGVEPVLSLGTSGEIAPHTLLVRGQESDVLGRSAEAQVALFGGERFELPRATLVALSPRLDGLPAVIEESQRHLRIVERTRILAAFGAFVAVAAAFVGLFTPAVAIVAVLLVSAGLSRL